MLDQPAGLLGKMVIASNVYGAFTAFKKATRLVEWVEKNPQEFDIVIRVEKLEKQYG